MKISVLQPKIVRGNIEHNSKELQKLINNATGEILISAEYVLTGSLVLDENINIKHWADESQRAINSLQIPNNKKLMINSLAQRNDLIYNSCTILPDNFPYQDKTYLDKPEAEAGIVAGNGITVKTVNGINIITFICSDLKQVDTISTAGAELILFIFHFTQNNYDEAMGTLTRTTKERGIPIIAASLSSDKNIGRSCYINGETVVSLGNEEGILEICI